MIPFYGSVGRLMQTDAGINARPAAVLRLLLAGLTAAVRVDRPSPRNLFESPLTDPSLTSPLFSSPTTQVTCARHVDLIPSGPPPQPEPRDKGPPRSHDSLHTILRPARNSRRRICPWIERRVEEHVESGRRPGVVLAGGVVTRGMCVPRRRDPYFWVPFGCGKKVGAGRTGLCEVLAFRGCGFACD